MPDDSPVPIGLGEPPRYFWFEGLLAGPVPADGSVLTRFVQRLRAIGISDQPLQVDGGRFTVMLPASPMVGARRNEDLREIMTTLFQELVGNLGVPGSVESNLRCTEVFPSSTRETLFVIQGREVKAVSRTRGTTPLDLQQDPAVTTPTVQRLGLSRRAAVIAGTLLLVGFGLTAWTSGWLDSVFGTRAEELAVVTGPFEGLLEIKVEQKFGHCDVTLTRGPNYPTTKAILEARLQAAETPAARAAVNAVADGGEIFLRLEGDEEKVLLAKSTRLRGLLEKEDAAITVEVAGRLGAKTLRLALDSGTK